MSGAVCMWVVTGTRSGRFPGQTPGTLDTSGGQIDTHTYTGGCQTSDYLGKLGAGSGGIGSGRCQSQTPVRDRDRSGLRLDTHTGRCPYSGVSVQCTTCVNSDTDR